MFSCAPDNEILDFNLGWKTEVITYDQWGAGRDGGGGGQENL